MPLHPRILVPLAAAFAFLGLTLFIMSGRTFAFDPGLILLFRQAGDPATPIGPQWLTEMMRDISGLGSFVGLGFMTLAATLALWLAGYRRLAIALVVNVVLATLVSTLLKIGIGRARPDVVEPSAIVFTASFPSGHAFLSAVVLLGIAGFIGLASRHRDITRLSIGLAWVLMLLIGVSRIYLGVHWPSDVLAGWCLGIAWSSLSLALAGQGMARAEPASAGTPSAG
ncbi:phosphatase PAP2 family protein [Bosea sp. BIWAKO-01]|uniref:phosphatase PAP2 family protein n=1 Tax=Bosea sp. BIWAKO-01 TaxID=506668 RepID=UPI0008539287|nr:phosphatase PAP2 family protein [Bosea sp. BIWAKO-01]GAU81143.1 membrane-associated phospholipid phosphatase [Bosea sp. BIWAKO-01]